LPASGIANQLKGFSYAGVLRTLFFANEKSLGNKKPPIVAGGLSRA